MLFSQLASNSKYNKTKAPTDWFNQYVNNLENIGYATTDFKFAVQKLTGDSVQVQHEILRVLGVILGSYAAELDLASSLLDGLNSQSSGPITIFSRESSDGDTGSFQVQTVGENDGIMTSHFTGWHLTVSSMVTNFLWWSWKTDSTTLEYGTEGFVQSDTMWNSIPPGKNITIRQQIYNKVSSHVSSYIDEVDF